MFQHVNCLHQILSTNGWSKMMWLANWIELSVKIGPNRINLQWINFGWLHRPRLAPSAGRGFYSRKKTTRVWMQTEKKTFCQILPPFFAISSFFSFLVPNTWKKALTSATPERWSRYTTLITQGIAKSRQKRRVFRLHNSD